MTTKLVTLTQIKKLAERIGALLNLLDVAVTNFTDRLNQKQDKLTFEGHNGIIVEKDAENNLIKLTKDSSVKHIVMHVTQYIMSVQTSESVSIEIPASKLATFINGRILRAVCITVNDKRANKKQYNAFITPDDSIMVALENYNAFYDLDILYADGTITPKEVTLLN